jgi:hypothetical protein
MVIACGLSGVFVFVPAQPTTPMRKIWPTLAQLAEMLRVVFLPQTDRGPHSEVCTRAQGLVSVCRWL